MADVICRWAWHNPHVTKRIAEDERITKCGSKDRKSPKTGRSRKRPIRPRTSLLEKLKNLHLLLRVLSFARWPLQVRFFCEDVYCVWQSWSDRVDGHVRSGIQVILDDEKPVGESTDDTTLLTAEVKHKRKRDALGNGGVEGIDASYNSLQGHLEKSIFLLGGDEAVVCSVCSQHVGLHNAATLVCPQADCKTASHVVCLAARFLEEDDTGNSVLPTSGKCPKCSADLQWIDLVKEMTFRARGEKEVAQLMRTRKKNEDETSTESKETQNRFGAEDVNGHESNEALVGKGLSAGSVTDESIADDWQYQEGDDEDTMSVSSTASAFSERVGVANPSKKPSATPRFEIVIEDSEGDDADVID